MQKFTLQKISRSFYGVILICLIVFSSSCSSAKKYKTMGVKCPSVKITDPGEIFSTYLISEEEIKFLKEEEFSPSDIDTIQKYGTEKNWPDAMNNLTSRFANADKIKLYRTYKLAKLNDKTILVIPASKNAEMISEWKPLHDIYIVIGAGGVKE